MCSSLPPPTAATGEIARAIRAGFVMVDPAGRTAVRPYLPPPPLYGRTAVRPVSWAAGSINLQSAVAHGGRCERRFDCGFGGRSPFGVFNEALQVRELA